MPGKRSSISIQIKQRSSNPNEGDGEREREKKGGERGRIGTRVRGRLSKGGRAVENEKQQRRTKAAREKEESSIREAKGSTTRGQLKKKKKKKAAERGSLSRPRKEKRIRLTLVRYSRRLTCLAWKFYLKEAQQKKKKTSRNRRGDRRKETNDGTYKRKPNSEFDY